MDWQAPKNQDTTTPRLAQVAADNDQTFERYET